MAAARDRAAARRGARGLRTRANNADSIVWWLYRHCGHRYLTVRDLSRSVADLGRATQLVEGHPDQIEPDGQPNASNTSIGTLHSSIAYHLGLAYYLQGDFARAVPVRSEERRVGKEC